MVYDVSRQETFTDLENWFKEAQENIGNSVPGVIVGNKIDLENKISKDVFDDFMKKFKFSHFYASAKND